MTTYNTLDCGAPILHDPHGFIVTNSNVAYTIVCSGRKSNPLGGPLGVVKEEGEDDGRA